MIYNLKVILFTGFAILASGSPDSSNDVQACSTEISTCSKDITCARILVEFDDAQCSQNQMCKSLMICLKNEVSESVDESVDEDPEENPAPAEQNEQNVPNAGNSKDVQACSTETSKCIKDSTCVELTMFSDAIPCFQNEICASLMRCFRLNAVCYPVAGRDACNARNGCSYDSVTKTCTTDYTVTTGACRITGHPWPVGMNYEYGLREKCEEKCNKDSTCIAYTVPKDENEDWCETYSPIVEVGDMTGNGDESMSCYVKPEAEFDFKGNFECITKVRVATRNRNNLEQALKECGESDTCVAVSDPTCKGFNGGGGIHLCTRKRYRSKQGACVYEKVQ